MSPAAGEVVHAAANSRNSFLGRGHSGAEALDGGFNFANPRRRSNSNGALKDFKTKFDVNEQDPVFEEVVPEDEEQLNKTETSSSISSTQEKV